VGRRLGSLILIKPHQIGWEEQVCRFDELHGGYVAINNHYKTRVMEAFGRMPVNRRRRMTPNRRPVSRQPSLVRHSLA
jgi:hypothetical protein